MRLWASQVERKRDTLDCLCSLDMDTRREKRREPLRRLCDLLLCFYSLLSLTHSCWPAAGEFFYKAKTRHSLPGAARKKVSLSSIEFHRFGCSAVCWGCWQLALGPTAATVTPARAFLFFDSRILSNRPAEATPPNAQYDGFLLQQTLDLPSFLLQCHVQPLHRDATSIGSRGLFS